MSFSWGRAQGSVSPSSKVGAEPAVPAGVGSGRARDLAVSWAPSGGGGRGWRGHVMGLGEGTEAEGKGGF